MPAPDSVAIESITEASDPGGIDIEIQVTTSSNEEYDLYVDEVDQQGTYQTEAYSNKNLSIDFSYTFSYQPEDLSNDIQIHAGPEGDTYWAVDEQSIAQSIGYTEVSIDSTSVSRSSGDIVVSADLSNATDATYSGTVTFTPSGSTLPEKTDSVSFSSNGTASVTFTDPPQGSYTIDISVSDSSASAQESFTSSSFESDIGITNVSFFKDGGDLVISGDVENTSSTTAYDVTIDGGVTGDVAYDVTNSNFSSDPSGTTTLQPSDAITVEVRWTDVQAGTYEGHALYVQQADTRNAASYNSTSTTVVITSFPDDISLSGFSLQADNGDLVITGTVENTSSDTSHEILMGGTVDGTTDYLFSDNNYTQSPFDHSSSSVLDPGESISVEGRWSGVDEGTYTSYQFVIEQVSGDGTKSVSEDNLSVTVESTNFPDDISLSGFSLQADNGDLVITGTVENTSSDTSHEILMGGVAGGTTDYQFSDNNYTQSPFDHSSSSILDPGESISVEGRWSGVDEGTYTSYQFIIEQVSGDGTKSVSEDNLSVTVESTNPLEDVDIQNIQSYSENQDAVVEFTLSNNSSEDIPVAVALTISNSNRMYDAFDTTHTVSPSQTPTIPANGTVDVVAKHTSVEPETYNTVIISLNYGTDYSKQESASSITVSPPASPNLNYDITPDPQTAPKGTTATMTLEVENTGDAEGTATLAVSNEQTGDVYISDKTLNVPAGETVQEDFSINTSPLSSGQDYTVQAIKQG